MIEEQKIGFEITVTLWNRDLKGLFDYTAPPEQLQVSKFNVGNYCKVFRDPRNHENYFTTGQTRVFGYFSFICQVYLQAFKSYTSFLLRPRPEKRSHTLQHPHNVPYLVLKPSQQGKIGPGFTLNEGDSIKIGLAEYTIIQLKTNRNVQSLFITDRKKKIIATIRDSQIEQQTHAKRRKRVTDQVLDETNTKKLKHKKIKKQQKNEKASSKAKEDSQNDSQLEANIQQASQSFEDENTIKFCQQKLSEKVQAKEKQTTSEQRTCKICLSNQQTQQDPFISVCQCKGSCSLTHAGCLKIWINSQTEVQNNFGVKSCLLKRSSCQICKHPFPTFIQTKDSRIPLIDIEIPRNAYMILQSSDPESIRKDEKRYILIDGKKNKVTKIGRNNDAQIKIKDITVSRKHAEIVYQNDQFTIQDKKSRFGTLIKLQNNMTFGDQQVSVQMGRCVFSFKPTSKKLALQPLINYSLP